MRLKKLQSFFKRIVQERLQLHLQVLFTPSWAQVYASAEDCEALCPVADPGRA
jgi:hypothetical protein